MLNFKEIVPHVAGKDLTIFTLAPESQCYWRRGISYQFGDLREMPFRDSWFDVVVCASTLEHVGMNNVNYDGRQHTLVEDDFVHAAQEILRVTRKGGTILITVPFGKRQLLKWNDAVFARQFDSLLLRQLADVFGSSLREIEFFQYDPDGWKKSHEAACQDVSYFNIHEQQHYDDDLAAAARSVACLRIVK